MTKIAVLADIHGNVPAMEAVIADIDSQDVDEVLVGGDLVGRGAMGSQVASRIAERGWPAVRGNHEDYLLAFRFKRVPAEWLDLDEWSASRWMAAELDEGNVRFIDSFPFALSSRLVPELRLVHGSPRSYSEGIGAWTSDEQLEEHLREARRPVLVCAHTHRPYQRRVAEGWVVNVGAVGLPFNRDRRAQYAILQHSADRWDVEFRQVDYDLERTINGFGSSGFRDAAGVTAELLELELRHAAPFLVPFLRWAEVRGVTPDAARLREFLDFFDPSESVGTFRLRLERL